MAILDRFLQVGDISRNKLQLVGVATMPVASKYEEIYAPGVKDFVYITDRTKQRRTLGRWGSESCPPYSSTSEDFFLCTS